jgi:hypothetical protein
MRELTPMQISTVERLVAHDYTPLAIPLYPNAIGVRRGTYAALLTPVENAGFRVLGEPCRVIEGNFSVRIKHDGREWFVWKSKKVEATPELLAELKQFSTELNKLLLPQT